MSALNSYRTAFEVGLVLAVGQLSTQEAVVAARGDYLSWQVALALFASLSVLGRNRRPLAAAVLPFSGAVLLGLLWPLLVTLYALALHRRTVTAMLVATLAMLVSLITTPPVSLWEVRGLGPVSFLAVAIVLGVWAQNRKQLITALNDRIKHVETERALRVEQARMAERARIAREMHDVLAHRLSLLVLHAGVLKRQNKTLPAPVRETLDLMKQTSGQALNDLRDVLGALRESDMAPGATAPALASPDDLVEEARAAGQQVTLNCTGDPCLLPTTHRLALHRIAQEGLTNARKYAHDAPTTVTIAYGPPQSTVRVSNTPGSPLPQMTPSGGWGLVGLTERVQALGGHLNAGPTGNGGFALEATLPTPPTPESR
ncbi:histidine kinase [Streptomyces sp. NPDC002262]|uniref:sensor histidine kinase n=1 Tax=Streptomyces sp. NPDC002262 TaxID=3154414 RepID=UPI0033275A26